MNDIWNLIKNSYLDNPRDVLTFGGRKYFYVYTEGDNVYLESGRNHSNSSNLSTSHILDKAKINIIFDAYKAGSKPSEITDITFNSVYWFGIFKDLKL